MYGSAIPSTTVYGGFMPGLLFTVPLGAVSVLINNTNRTSLVDWPTFRIDFALTYQIDIARFAIKRFPTKTFKPAVNDDVEIFEGTTKIFGGRVVEITEVIDGQLEMIGVICKDHSFEMDSKLVQKTFEDTTIDAIIEEIKDDFLPAGFTTIGVDATNPVSFIAFNFEQPSKVFMQLADLVGADWFVDEDKDIKFFIKNSITAPFGLSDTNENYEWNSLTISEDIKNLRNTIFVRGGTFKGDSFSEAQEADGETETFTFGFRYSSITWEVDRGSGFASESFGIDNIDDPTSFDWLYNFQEKAMKLASATKPVAGNKIKITGLPFIPVIIKTRDNASISKFGEFEHKIIDKSLDSKEGARDRATGEILKWANGIKEAQFVTIKSGLRVGQKIRIQSDLRAIDEFFVIDRIATRLRTPTLFEHRVSCSQV